MPQAREDLNVMCYDCKTDLYQLVYLYMNEIYRGSDMSAHVLLILLNELGGKEIKCEACHAFYLFRNKFNKFNNTGAQMLDSICHDIKII